MSKTTRSFPENITENTIVIEPDEELLERINVSSLLVDNDINIFDCIIKKLKSIFLERRGKYGNHLDNAIRFPHEDKAGLYLKCTRTIRHIEDGSVLDEDTLIDLAVYSILILSVMEVE